MSRFNVCNLIELLTQLALVLVTRPGPWQARQVESTLFDNYTNFEEVSPQHNVIIAQFFKDIAIFPPQTLFFESFLISF